MIDLLLRLGRPAFQEPQGGDASLWTLRAGQAEELWPATRLLAAQWTLFAFEVCAASALTKVRLKVGLAAGLGQPLNLRQQGTWTGTWRRGAKKEQQEQMKEQQEQMKKKRELKRKEEQEQGNEDSPGNSGKPVKWNVGGTENRWVHEVVIGDQKRRGAVGEDPSGRKRKRMTTVVKGRMQSARSRWGCKRRARWAAGWPVRGAAAGASGPSLCAGVGQRVRHRWTPAQWRWQRWAVESDHHPSRRRRKRRRRGEQEVKSRRR